MEADIDVVPQSVGAASRRWDEQHLQLTAAGRQLDGAPVGGFSPGVRAAAAGFVEAWSEHCAALGLQCEAVADGLRASVGQYLAADEGAFLRSSTLLPYLKEVR